MGSVGGEGFGGKCLSILQGLYQGHRRFVRVGERDTEWIKCDKGVKQGYVLSPLLFALYLANLSKQLQEVEGVKLGNECISGLLFADDLVLTAESEVDLQRQLGVLANFIRVHRLEINMAKTKVMKMGPGCYQEKAWPIVNPDGSLIGDIEETNVCDYLGVRLGCSRIFQQHCNMMERAIPRQIGLVKVKAKNTPLRKTGTDLLWRMASRPKLLYGVEVIHNVELPSYTPMIKCWIGRIPLRALIDTGATVSIISKSLAKRAKVTIEEETQEIRIASGSKHTVHITAPIEIAFPLADGSMFTTKPMPFLVLDTLPQDCLIGCDLLNKYHAAPCFAKQALFLFGGKKKQVD